MANVTNGQLKKLIDSLNEKVVEALDIWKAAAVQLLTLHADVKDLAAEIEKQTALADQEHARLKENDAVHTADIKEMRETIKGNGKPGLEASLIEARAEIKIVSTRLGWLIAILIALVIPVYGGGVAYVFGLWKPHIANASTIAPPPIVVTVTPHGSYFTRVPVDRPTATDPWK